MSEEEKLILSLGSLTAASNEPRTFKARFVKAGRIRSAGNRKSRVIVEPVALTDAVAKGMFESKAVFIDHAGFFDYPSIKNLAGVTSSALWNELDQSVEGTITFYEKAGEYATLLTELLAQDNPPDVGLSLVFWPIWAQAGPDDPPSNDRKIIGISHIESVDLVFEPAADGRIIQALSAHGLAPVANPHGGSEMTQPNTSQAAPETTPPQGTTVAEEWNAAVRRSAAASIIAASGLPAASRERLAALDYETPEAVNQAIQEEQNFLARLVEDQTVQIGGAAPRGGGVQVGLNGVERVRLAAEALLAGTRPASNVAPLSGIRELYILLSGDYEMTGMFQGERVYLANVNSSTMAGMVANALNKAVVNVFQQYPRWWEPISQVMDFSSLQQVKWITLGGVGELPTVAEGAAYTEMTWDDQTETATFVKKGGYLGLTLEAIDKDDTRKLQAAPQALAQAAWLTLSKAVSGIFTDNAGVGPTMSDSVALFNAAHNNLNTTALSVTSWAAVRTAMRKQTELHSGERLGAIVAPKYLVVPPDLEITALQVLTSSHDYTYALANGTAAPQNIFAQGNEAMARLQSAQGRVIVVDLWTDTNNWAAVADPLMYPTIGLGFRYGRTPEIFSVASPTAGLMFTNDTLPIKVRYFFAVGPMDWRGLYKQNVA
ncbi:MAG TPA: hypothetical protein VLA49_06850 [Anaerolineales bacterium]|nr:hypothetical protein [Anaerolineales bacterium]